MSVEEKTRILANLANDNISRTLDRAELAEAEDTIATFIGDIYEAMEDRRSNPAGIGRIPSEEYLGEQLAAMRSFVRMAVGLEECGSYTSKKIIENVIHYQHKINRLFPSP